MQAALHAAGQSGNESSCCRRSDTVSVWNISFAGNPVRLRCALLIQYIPDGFIPSSGTLNGIGRHLWRDLLFIRTPSWTARARDMPVFR